MSEFNVIDRPSKPLGRKSYGSIPHLLGSRRGPADHGVNDGQQAICTAKARDGRDLIIVQEKLDGSNVGVGRVGDEIHAVGRAGYPAATSPYEQHHLFADWVRLNERRFRKLLDDGERVCGEWLAQAHGTRYDLTGRSPFVAFDIIAGNTRLSHDAVNRRCRAVDLPTAPTLWIGSPVTIEAVMERIGQGWYGAVDPVEGAVWRVERGGAVDFLAKYVRPEKVDGCYLPEISGRPILWNWRPE